MFFKNINNGFKIGRIIGICIGVIVLIGILICNWNIVEGSVVPDGICRSSLTLFYPFVFFSFIILLLFLQVIPIPIVNLILGLLIPLIIYVLVFAFIGSLIEKIYRKIKLKKL